MSVIVEPLTTPLEPEEAAKLSARDRRIYERNMRERLNNTYRWSDEFGAVVLPNATPDGFGGSLAFKTHEPIPIKFIQLGVGTAAELGKDGKTRRNPGADPLYGKLLEFYSKPIPAGKFESGSRPVPTEMEAAAKRSEKNERTGTKMSVSNANNGRERMLILWDGGSPALTVSAVCVFFSDNQDWVVAGSRGSIDLSKLRIGAEGRYAMSVADPATGESRTMNVVNFGISMPNPIGGGAYAVFGIVREETNHDEEDGIHPDGESIEDNASFI